MRSKSNEQLQDQMDSLGELFAFPETLHPPSIEPDEIVDQDQDSLKQAYPARYDYYLELLRKQRSGNLKSDDLDRAELWFGMMNSLTEHANANTLNPEIQLLYEAQAPVFRSFIDFLEKHGRDDPRGYIRLPTGTGKTVLATEIAKSTGLRTLFLTPKKILVEQTHDKINEYTMDELDVGMVYGLYKQPGQDVTIATYATMIRQIKSEDRLIEPSDYDLVILDEGHAVLGEETRRILRHFDHAIQLGLTATPDYYGQMYRQRRELQSLLPHLIHEMSIKEAIELDLLCPFQVGIVETDIDMSNVSIKAGQYDQQELEAAINVDPRNMAAVELYLKAFPDKKVAIFTGSVMHSKALDKLYKEHGVRSEAIFGRLSQSEQQRILRELDIPIEQGGLQVIVNPEMLAEGYDQPKFDAVFNLQPSLSPVRVQQRAGRVLRKNDDNPHKVAMIVEFIDKNFKVPPFTFADDQIAGAAALFPSGFESETDWSIFDGLSINGYNLIAQPESVEEYVAGLEDYREQASLEIRSSWLSLSDLAQQLGVPQTRVREGISVLAQSEGRWFEENCRRTYKRSGRGTAKHYSPEIQAKLYDVIDIPQQAPAGWSTTTQLAAMYDLPQERVRTVLKRIVAGNPESSGIYAAEKGKVVTRLYYSPDVERQLAEQFSLEYLNGRRPNGWVDRADLTRSFGKRAAEEALVQTLRANPGLRTNHVRQVTDPERQEAVEVYSPNVINAIQRYRMPPKTWQSMAEVRKQLDETPQSLAVILDEIKQTKPKLVESGMRTCTIDGRHARYISPKLQAAIRKAIEKRLSTPLSVDLGDGVEGSGEEWVELDRLPAKLQSVVVMFNERFPSLAHHQIRILAINGHIDGRIEAGLAERLRSIPFNQLAIDDNWHTASEIADVFNFQYGEVVHAASYVLKTIKGQDVVGMRRFRLNGHTEEVYDSDFTAEVLSELGV